MPGGDGTGPMGLGPRMGRGRGMCAGRCMGAAGSSMRQGRRGRGWQAFGTSPVVGAQQELPVLQQQAQAMATALENLRTRIEQLQGHKPTD